jgi:quercetin dioxygenase-like cupin family protein
MPLVKSDNPPLLYPEPGMVRQVLANNPQLMMVRHTLAAGWVGAAHSHPHHQILYVLSGRIRLVLQGESYLMHAGDSVAIDGGVEHQATAMEASVVLDVFTPSRDEYKA